MTVNANVVETLVRTQMAPMIEEARQKGMWLHCSYQDLWFSPDKLEAAQAAGRFCWGKDNWTLRNPQEHLRTLRRRAEQATTEADSFAHALREWNDKRTG